MLAYGFANAYAKPLSQRLGAAQLIFFRGLLVVLILGAVSIPYYENLTHWTVALATIGLGGGGLFAGAGLYSRNQRKLSGYHGADCRHFAAYYGAAVSFISQCCTASSTVAGSSPGGSREYNCIC